MNDDLPRVVPGVDCSQSCSNKIDLKCHQHTICEECLAKRGKKQPQNVLDCESCKAKEYNPSYSFKDALLCKQPNFEQNTAIAPLKDSVFFNSKMPGIWIFVDDSNIWIEAMKFQCREKGFKTSQDHRVRINIGKLTDLIAGDRQVQQGILYGSEPPPVDTVWDKIRAKGWQVERQRRSRITGKEKKVDTKLVADVTRTAITTPVHERTTIVLVTGDADIIPALEEIIKEDEWKIEVYMWRQGIAKDIKVFADVHKSRVEIRHLDEYLSKVTFTNMKFAFDKSLMSKVKENGVVFSMVDKAFGNRIPHKAWCNQLDSIAQWPFQYYWFERDNKTTNNLVIVFGEDKEAGKYDIAAFLTAIQPIIQDTEHQDKYHLPKVMAVQTFLEFTAKEFGSDREMQQSGPMLEQVGIYDEDDVRSGHENDKNWISDSEDKWSSVKPQHRRPRPQYSTPCPFKFNCRYGTRCRCKHSPEEIRYFSQRKEGRGNHLRKVKGCKMFEKNQCRRLKEDCDYAHGSEDAWCLQCHTTGHYTNDCTN